MEQPKRSASLNRILTLMKMFNDGKTVCMAELQQHDLWFNKSEKTIRRDLDLIRKHFPDGFERVSKENGCYKAMTSELFNKLLTPDNLSLLVQTFHIAQRNNLFKSLKIDETDRKIIAKYLKKTEQLYIFKNKPFENTKGDFEMFKRLEKAIYHKHKIEIDFTMANGEQKLISIKPYKILFMYENFYLASELVDERYTFSRYRISKIKSFRETGENFIHNRDIDDFIQGLQSPFARYTEQFRTNLIKVQLEADKSIIRYFKQKKYLTSQTEQLQDNGNLLVEYTVTDIREVESVIKRWIPFVKVISPQSLKDKLTNDLTTFLKNS